MTTHAVDPADAPAQKRSGWWVVFLFTLFGFGIPVALSIVARWLFAG